MTGFQQPPVGPPWSEDDIADLHAGLFEPGVERELRARMAQDPAASAVLAALDATTEHLGAAPLIPMPTEVAARLEAALAKSAAPKSNVVDLASRRGIKWGAGVLAVAAAAAAIAVISTQGLTTPGAASSQPLALNSAQLRSAVPAGVLGVTDPGPVQDKLTGCLEANNASGKPLGTRQAVLDGGKRAVILILPGGTAGRYRVLVVGPDCGPGTSDTISDTIVG
ncbi:hypothetical protein D5S17_00275 [Pseudonocardiaceae bacterium YIM PH 21723]|nr:hypothetical protein D5S17_00275 [Pseudonocardiaceae bacterium YIM PH 21723]